MPGICASQTEQRWFRFDYESDSFIHTCLALLVALITSSGDNETQISLPRDVTGQQDDWRTGNIINISFKEMENN